MVDPHELGVVKEDHRQTGQVNNLIKQVVVHAYHVRRKENAIRETRGQSSNATT